jgi:prepilin-type N-terminal cleavage/methylation domain-containing protein
MARRSSSIKPIAFRRRRGFTLVESMIAATILGAAVVGIVSPLCASHQQIDSRQQTDAALTLAGQLLEEISARPFLGTDGLTRSGPDAGQTTRATFTSQGNYNGYSDSTSSLTMLDGTSVSLGLLAVYTRTVTVQYLSSRTGPIVSSGDYALITVTVSSTSPVASSGNNPQANASVSLSGLPTVQLSRITTKAKELF